MTLGPLAAGLALTLLLGACGSAPTNERLTPQTMSESPPPETADSVGPDPRELPPQPPAEPDPAEESSPLMVVIEDPNSRAGKTSSLVEASKAEMERRRAVGKSNKIVVTDKNLHEFRKGQLTEVDAGQPPTPPAKTAPPRQVPPAAGTPVAGPPARADDETYWRSRILQARTNWAESVAEAERLKGRIAELRQRFYAEDDPYYRDSEIKPSWDRALDRLEETRAEIERYRLEVRNTLEEGRRASALPGWLREGIELEPDILAGVREGTPQPPTEYRPGEPEVADDPDGRRR